MSQRELLRTPYQKRSQKRVAAILQAARVVIQEKGCVRMTVLDIAKTANVSAASIYQYFRSKSDIIDHLAEEILRINTEKNKTILEKAPQSLLQLSQLAMEMLDQYLDLRTSDPVMIDIWAAYCANGGLSEADHADDLANRDLLFAASAHLFDPQLHDAARRNLLILVRMGASIADLAVRSPANDRQQIVIDAKTALYAAWHVTIMPLASSSHLQRPLYDRAEMARPAESALDTAPSGP